MISDYIIMYRTTADQLLDMTFCRFSLRVIKMSSVGVFAGRPSAAVKISAICSNMSKLISRKSKQAGDTDLSDEQTVSRNRQAELLTSSSLLTLVCAVSPCLN